MTRAYKHEYLHMASTTVIPSTSPSCGTGNLDTKAEISGLEQLDIDDRSCSSLMKLASGSRGPESADQEGHGRLLSHLVANHYAA